MLKRIILSCFLTLLYFFGNNPAEAKLLPRFRSPVKKSAGNASGIIISPRLRPDRKALLVNFANLNRVRTVTYTLMYQTDGKDEGISGIIDAGGENSTTRELLFGTCSSGVCRYHANITGMSLEIVSELKTGKKYLRRFKVKV